MSIRRGIQIAVAGAAVIASLSLLPGMGLAASPAPGTAGPESPLPSGATGSPAAPVQMIHGFAAPEDAVKNYLAAVAANDFEAVLADCAVHEMAAGYRFDLHATRLNAIIFQSMWAPATNPFYTQINTAIQEGQIAHSVMFLSYSLLTTLKLDEVNVITPVDQAQLQQLISQVDPAQLSDLSVLDIRFPKASVQHSPRLLNVYATAAKVYSADEQTERVALVSHAGNDYVVGFTLLRYGSNWFVASATSPLYGMSSTGIAMPTTQEEFDAATSS